MIPARYKINNSNDKILIRIANPSDLDGIGQLEAQIDQQHHQHLPEIFAAKVEPERQRNYLQTVLETENGALLVACESEEILGFISCKWMESTELPFLNLRRICRIGTIVIAEKHWQRGIGKLLMEAATNWGREHGALEVQLTVMDFNRDALAFYERLGFAPMSHVMRKTLA